MEIVNKNNGSILIVTLWIMLVLSVLALSLSFRGTLEAKMAGAYHSRFLELEKLRSGINLGIYLLETDETPSVDSPEDSWYNPQAFEGSLPEGWLEDLEIEIQDEESKINLNTATKKILSGLWGSLGEIDILLKSREEDLTSDILFYRGDSALEGKAAIGSQYKGKPFSFLEEIYLLKNFEPDDFSNLKDFITVYPLTKGVLQVNINTAPAEVIRAVIWGAASDDRTRQTLLDAVLNYREVLNEEEAPLFFDKSHLTAYQFLLALGLPREVKLVSLAVQSLRNFTVDSLYFSITAKLKDKKNKVSAIVGPSGKNGSGTDQDGQFSVLSWSEM